MYVYNSLSLSLSLYIYIYMEGHVCFMAISCIIIGQATNTLSVCWILRYISTQLSLSIYIYIYTYIYIYVRTLCTHL